MRLESDNRGSRNAPSESHGGFWKSSVNKIILDRFPRSQVRVTGHSALLGNVNMNLTKLLMSVIKPLRTDTHA